MVRFCSVNVPFGLHPIINYKTRSRCGMYDSVKLQFSLPFLSLFVFFLCSTTVLFASWLSIYASLLSFQIWFAAMSTARWSLTLNDYVNLLTHYSNESHYSEEVFEREIVFLYLVIRWTWILSIGCHNAIVLANIYVYYYIKGATVLQSITLSFIFNSLNWTNDSLSLSVFGDFKDLYGKVTMPLVGSYFKRKPNSQNLNSNMTCYAQF